MAREAARSERCEKERERERESRVEEDGRRSTSVEYNRAACSISREIAMEGRMEAAPHEPGILLHEF